MDNNGNNTTEYEEVLAMLARSHIEGIRRGYRQGYEDGHADGHQQGIQEERKRMDPIVSDATRHGSPLGAAELRNRRRD